jgi:hypothetical protein
MEPIDWTAMPEPSATHGDDGTWYVETLHEGVRTSIQVLGWGSDDPSLRRVPQATIEARFGASGIATRYYTPKVQLASFALPPFILDIVEAARGDVDVSRPDLAP